MPDDSILPESAPEGVREQLRGLAKGKPVGDGREMWRDLRRATGRPVDDEPPPEQPPPEDQSAKSWGDVSQGYRGSALTAFPGHNALLGSALDAVRQARPYQTYDQRVRPEIIPIRKG